MTKQDQPASAMLTVDEAAKYLGIGRALAYEAARTGQIPSIRIGKRILVPKSALSRLEARNVMQSMEQRKEPPS